MKAAEAAHDPDRLVVEAIQQGDPDAMADFVHRQGPWVRGVVFAAMGRADEVDDVTQRVWLQVWREAPRLEDAGRWRPWLYRISRHAAIDTVRGRQRRRRLRDDAASQAAGRQGGSPPDERIVADERHRAVLEAIAALPALYREPFVLKHLQGWSYREIGEVLDLPTDTVETRLVRARRRLRERLKDRI